MAHVLFFGGSSVQGVGDAEGGWVDRFKREMHAHMYGPEHMGQIHGLFNLGILGNTTANVLERLPHELPERQWRNQNTVVVFALGTNDSKAIDAPNNFVSTSQGFMANMQNIIEYTRSYTPHIVLIGLTPIDESRTNPNSNGSFYTMARIQEFNQALEGVAASYKLPIVELFAPLLSMNWQSMLFDDGLHLNTAGYEWVYEQVRQPLWTAMQQADQQPQ